MRVRDCECNSCYKRNFVNEIYFEIEQAPFVEHCHFVVQLNYSSMCFAFFFNWAPINTPFVQRQFAQFFRPRIGFSSTDDWDRMNCWQMGWIYKNSNGYLVLIIIHVQRATYYKCQQVLEDRQFKASREKKKKRQFQLHYSVTFVDP